MPAPPLVLYHKNCNDGFACAWITSKVFPDAEFVPMQYNDEAPSVKRRSVYILDFSFKREKLLWMKDRAESLVVIDHHATAKKELEGIEGCFIDISHCGARLTWDYFFPNTECPWIVDYVEDRDLWRWKLPHSKWINAGLSSYKKAFEIWDDLLASGIYKLKWEGCSIVRSKDQTVNEIVGMAREIEIDGHKILAANTSCYFSDVANVLAEGRSFGAAWFQRKDGQVVFSLRSVSDGGADVSKIAAKFGGGGHKHSAGFSSEPGVILV